jgi:hypothetical protein
MPGDPPTVSADGSIWPATRDVLDPRPSCESVKISRPGEQAPTVLRRWFAAGMGLSFAETQHCANFKPIVEKPGHLALLSS